MGSDYIFMESGREICRYLDQTLSTCAVLAIGWTPKFQRLDNLLKSGDVFADLLQVAVERRLQASTVRGCRLERLVQMPFFPVSALKMKITTAITARIQAM